MNFAMKRTITLTSCAVALTLIMSGVALARDDDDDYYRRGNAEQARNYGYQNGYNDGAKHGRHEGREHDANDYHPPDWERATHGYKSWMGPVDSYRRGYQEGFENGFRDAYRNTAQSDGYRENYEAYRFGYDDGATAARSDLELRKPYNSKPRGRYDDRDHGYRRGYGSKDRYKDEYTNGYRAGYDANYRY